MDTIRSYLGGRYPESVRWIGLLRGYGWEVYNEGASDQSILQSDWEIDMANQTLSRILIKEKYV